MTRGCVDKRVSHYPVSCPMTSRTITKYLVECCDELFLVRVHIGDSGQLVTSIEIHRLSEEENELSWDQVWDIGNNALFLSGSYSASLCANEAGVVPNRIYFVVAWLDGPRLYTFYLEDQTFSFSLLVSESNLMARCSEVLSKQLHWVFTPSSLKNIQREIQSSSDVKELNKLGHKCKEHENRITFSRKWTELPLELVKLLFPRLSLVDCIRLSAVCKEWSLTSDAVPKANAWPWLMHSPNTVDGICKFFDPVNEREYTLKVGVLSTHQQLTFRFSKDGWVVITEGNATTFILNPFTEEKINLPTIGRYNFHGISFTGIPSSVNCQVFGFYFHFDGSFIEVFSCRQGEEEWSTKMFSQIETPFYGSKHNPVLYDGEFYCLDKRGRLGVLDPDTLAWRVLSKPEPIYYETFPPKYDSCHLILVHGDFIAVFRLDHTSTIHVFKLDWSKMSWAELGDLGDFTLFVSHQHSIVAPSVPRNCSNRIYFPKFDGRDHRMGVFYSMDDQTYHPRFYGLEEPTISVWLQPNIVPTFIKSVG